MSLVLSAARIATNSRHPHHKYHYIESVYIALCVLSCDEIYLCRYSIRIHQLTQSTSDIHKMIAIWIQQALLAAALWSSPTYQTAIHTLSPAFSDDYILGPAIEMPQISTDRIRRQSDTVGSWSLRVLSCPEDTQDCGDSSIKACCTKNTVCVEYGFKVACCPSGILEHFCVSFEILAEKVLFQ